MRLKILPSDIEKRAAIGRGALIGGTLGALYGGIRAEEGKGLETALRTGAVGAGLGAGAGLGYRMFRAGNNAAQVRQLPSGASAAPAKGPYTMGPIPAAAATDKGPYSMGEMPAATAPAKGPYTMGEMPVATAPARLPYAMGEMPAAAARQP